MGSLKGLKKGSHYGLEIALGQPLEDGMEPLSPSTLSVDSSLTVADGVQGLAGQ